MSRWYHGWDQIDFLRSKRVTRLEANLYDAEGALEQRYERHYDLAGRYLGGRIQHADGRTLNVTTDGLEPSTILHGPFVFIVHYLQNTSQPEAPAWFAFTFVVYDAQKRVYPLEYCEWPDDQKPPAIDGSGATSLEAYRHVQRQLFSMVPGVPPEV